MSVFVCGDLHGHYDIKKLSSKKFPEGQGLTKDDYVIILGDFGLVFHNHRTSEEHYWLNWLNDKPWTTLFFRGNHDNEPKLKYDLKDVSGLGDTIAQVDDFSIYRLLDGHVYSISGKTFLILGGAFSIDKGRRIEGKDWWPTEEMTFFEQKLAMQNVELYNWKFDYILSHDAPSYVRDVLHSHHTEKSGTVRFLDNLFLDRKLEFKHHYFGHHHMDRTVHEKHTCCFYKIHELTGV